MIANVLNEYTNTNDFAFLRALFVKWTYCLWVRYVGANLFDLSWNFSGFNTSAGISKLFLKVCLVKKYLKNNTEKQINWRNYYKISYSYKVYNSFFGFNILEKSTLKNNKNKNT